MEVDQLELIFNLFEKADLKALEQINSCPEEFKDFVDSESKANKGIKWDDIIVNFEWKVTIKKSATQL